MGFRSKLLKPLAKVFVQRLNKDSLNAVSHQKQILHRLIQKAKNTEFGKEHDFDKIETHREYKAAVPLRDFEQHKKYVNRIIDGHLNVLWPGLPIYFAKTSGTTSGSKFIPITKDSISNHINGARNALLNYSQVTGKRAFADGKMIFLSGSPELSTKGEIPTGRLSGIVNHHVPAVLRSNQLPTYRTNCLSNWQKKLDSIISETMDADMRLISGIPPWIQMYFDYLTERSGKSIGDLFPNFSLMVHGGVNFAPYEKRIRESVGHDIDILETYPASEGFFAYDDFQGEGLLLNTNAGIFYEFVSVANYGKPNAKRLSLGEVEMGVNYAMIITSNAGLWSYVIGDSVSFTTIQPYRIKVTGRIEHFISAFGEHVIDEEVCAALRAAVDLSSEEVNEFSVAPNMGSEGQLPFHEWFIEFKHHPRDIPTFVQYLDRQMCDQNPYYNDLIVGEILQELKIVPVPEGTFHRYMESRGKLGGQNKIPHLSDDRSIAKRLIEAARSTSENFFY